MAQSRRSLRLERSAGIRQNRLNTHLEKRQISDFGILNKDHLVNYQKLTKGAKL